MMRISIRRFSVSLRVRNQISSLALRPYQQECVDTCLKSLETTRRIAVSLATGGGKTVIFSHLIDQIPPNPKTGRSKTLILVHRKELADQAIASLRRVYPEYKIELDMANRKPSHAPDIDVVVASVPTLNRSTQRLESHDPGEYKAIVVDECHHGVADSYTKILKHFGCDSADCDIALLGFSATLSRYDELPLGLVFDEIVFDKNLVDLIREGYLSDFSWIQVSAGLELSQVAIGQDGDYKMDELASHVNKDEINALVFQSYQHFAEKYQLRSSLFFCVNVAHLESLSLVFRSNGVNAQYVTGNTSKFERERLIAEFSNGQLPVLMNCGVFTEGTDIPNIDSIFIVRPTQSKTLLTQMVGRGLRLHENKHRCYVIDFVDAHKVGVHSNPTLEGKMKTNGVSLFESDTGRGKQEGPEIEDIKYMEYDTLDGYQKIFEKFKEQEVVQTENIIGKFKTSQFPWIQLRRDVWGLSIGNEEFYQIKIYPTGAKILSFVKTIRRGKIRYPESQKVAEKATLEELFAEFEKQLEKYPEKYRSYRQTLIRGAITQKQRDFIRSVTINLIDKNPKIDKAKFIGLLDKKLNVMSKFAASNLIFAYTVSRTNALKLFVKQQVLPSKALQKYVVSR
ncbi:hypothetical protein KL921_001433 [Ogataea angusta]|nr:hypothetical protein KL921_001433 [Ogataea angusta]KAG7848144.1 hypothetical protein KL941_002323 [Ogataea angusta]